MKKNCIICGKEFEIKNKAYNRNFCYEPHIVKCSVCNKGINLNEKSSKVRRDYLQKGEICCSQKCGRELLYNDKTKVKNITDKVKQTNLKKYGYVCPLQNETVRRKTIMTNLKKYGVENIAQNEVIKDKIRLTNRNRYGAEYPAQNLEIQEKIKQTMIAKYGAPYTMQSDKLVEKVKQTNLKNYGTEYLFQTLKFKEDLKQINLKKYGVEQILQAVEIRDKIEQTNLRKYGVKYTSQAHLPITTVNIVNNKDLFREYLLSTPYENRSYYKMAKDLKTSTTLLCHKYHEYSCEDIPINSQKSSLEDDIWYCLDEWGINNKLKNNRSILNNQELDIYIPEKNLAIECNGTYWHSVQRGKDKNYHYNKSKLCEEKGIRLIHIFEYEWENERQRPILENIIKNALGINKNKLYARKLDIEVRKSAEMREFFDKNNIQGFRGGKFAICLVDKQTREVYMSYMMGKAFFGKGKYEWEVIRGATKLGYTIVGGASKIFKYFIKNYNPMNCVYYIDYNYFNGNSLKNLPNMKFIKTQPSFKNYWVKDGKIKNREPLRHKEITKLYKTGEVLQIYNAGTKVYLWERD